MKTRDHHVKKEPQMHKAWCIHILKSNFPDFFLTSFTISRPKHLGENPSTRQSVKIARLRQRQALTARMVCPSFCPHFRLPLLMTTASSPMTQAPDFRFSLPPPEDNASPSLLN
ncbi:hypothetical protein PoB_005627200 [Plakobranchus ocellatus]|uniref:Uncharacterized protein n=1 Tax=Plakobranchus ocellatus TaxID=259542 RepID=A0AAV4CEJ8_9GAST|nr:hypothetical protein PoB_005627200 [Plakobranchus ocellatus]